MRHYRPRSPMGLAGLYAERDFAPKAAGVASLPVGSRAGRLESPPEVADIRGLVESFTGLLQQFAHVLQCASHYGPDPRLEEQHAHLQPRLRDLYRQLRPSLRVETVRAAPRAEEATLQSWREDPLESLLAVPSLRHMLTADDGALEERLAATFRAVEAFQA